MYKLEFTVQTGMHYTVRMYVPYLCPCMYLCMYRYSASVMVDGE